MLFKNTYRTKLTQCLEVEDNTKTSQKNSQPICSGVTSKLYASYKKRRFLFIIQVTKCYLATQPNVQKHKMYKNPQNLLFYMTQEVPSRMLKLISNPINIQGLEEMSIYSEKVSGYADLLGAS